MEPLSEVAPKFSNVSYSSAILRLLFISKVSITSTVVLDSILYPASSPLAVVLSKSNTSSFSVVIKISVPRVTASAKVIVLPDAVHLIVLVPLI